MTGLLVASLKRKYLNQVTRGPDVPKVARHQPAYLTLNTSALVSTWHGIPVLLVVGLGTQGSVPKLKYFLDGMLF